MKSTILIGNNIRASYSVYAPHINATWGDFTGTVSTWRMTINCKTKNYFFVETCHDASLQWHLLIHHLNRMYGGNGCGFGT